MFPYKYRRKPVILHPRECYISPVYPTKDELYIPTTELGMLNINMLLDISSKVWTLRAWDSYRRPWHEKWVTEPKFMQHGQTMSLSKTFFKVLKSGINLRSYCRLSALASEKTDWESAASLFCRFENRTATLALKKDCDLSLVSLEELLDFLGLVMAKQVEIDGSVRISKEQVFGQNGHKFKYATLHSLLEKLHVLKKENVDFEEWLGLKVQKIKKKFPDDPIYLKSIINPYLDPTTREMSKLKESSENPWHEIIKFLGLDPDVQITKGYIPKGFQIAGYHETWQGSCADIKMFGDYGYYYVKKGDRFLGRYHYMGQNGFLCIAVTPENFHLFKADWFSDRKAENPTWEEIRDHSAFKDYWNEDGTPTKPFLKKVKWRKK